MSKKVKKVFKNRMSSTGKTLLASIMSMVLCLTMLLGTTLAWFADTASNQNNRITTGILDVQLLKYDGTSYADATDGDVKIFDEHTVWEPNRTEVVLLQVKNNGNLAMDYNMNLVVTPDADNKADHEEVMDYAIISGFDAAAYRGEAAEGAVVEQKAILQSAGITSWEEILRFTKEGCTVETNALPKENVKVAPNGALEEGKSDCFLLAVHMDESAGNTYMNMGLTIDVTVDAKQRTLEADSFGTEYDEVSWEEIQINSVLNTNLLKNSGFDTGLVEDASKGWSALEVVGKKNNPGTVVTKIENNQLVVSSSYDAEKNYDFNAVAYQTIDLSEFLENPVAFEGFQYQISAKFGADVNSTNKNGVEELVYVTFVDGDGKILNPSTSSNPNMKPAGTQILRVYGDQMSSAALQTFESVESVDKTIPQGTKEIVVYLVIRNCDTNVPTHNFYMDDVEFKITKKAATQ